MPAQGDELLHAISSNDPRENFVLFLLAIVRDQKPDRLPDHFRFAITEQLLGRAIPGDDNAFKILRDDRHIGRIDDGPIMIVGIHSFVYPSAAAQKAPKPTIVT